MRILLGVLFSLLTILSSHAAALVWKVEHDLRFLRLSSDPKIHELVFQQQAFDVDQKINKEFGCPSKAGGRNHISGSSTAKWIDRRCQRSMFGKPTRAAIAAALAGRQQHAVTYINFACSGAEAMDGPFWPQDGRECIRHQTNKSNRYLKHQVSGVVGSTSCEWSAYILVGGRT